MSDETPTKSAAARKPLKRRKFDEAFKRKVVREATKTSMAAVINKYKLPGSSRGWPDQFPFLTPKAPKSGAAKPAKPNGKAVQLGPQREAIIFLRQSERAFADGRAKRGRLLSQLALSTLSGD